MTTQYVNDEGTMTMTFFEECEQVYYTFDKPGQHYTQFMSKNRANSMMDIIGFYQI